MASKTERKVRVFSALEFANLCGVVNQTALNWIRNGFIKAFPTPGGQYRLYAEDIKEFMIKKEMQIPSVITEVVEANAKIPSTLIVDDDRDLNESIKSALTILFPEMEIFQAFDGFDAGKTAIEKKPALILLDLNLPGVDGFKLLEAFKTEEVFENPYVIVSTGNDDQITRIRAHELKADQYLPKPTTIDKISKAINTVRQKPRRGANDPVSRYLS